MDPVNIAHLHVHSHFTLLGATPSVEQLATRAAGDGCTHLALTDTNALYGAVAFDRACRAVGVQPIIGMALTLAPPTNWPAAEGPGLLVLLATEPAGYRSLCRLSSLVQNRPDRLAQMGQGVAWAQLKANRDGLICVSGGRRGWLERLIRAGDEQAARRFAGKLGGVFGERAYLALELHKPDDRAIAREITALGERFGLPTVAVQPVFTLEPEERERLRLLAAIDENCQLDAVPKTRLPDKGDPDVDLHWLDPGGMARRFAEFPDALARIEEVTAACRPCLPDGRPIWPVLKLDHDLSPDDALANRANVGMTNRYGPEPGNAVRERLAHELAAIARHGYAPLFLLVADVVAFARQEGIPVSTRGSVANSLVAFCVGITDVDPVAHDLLFERFLNPARTELPDIDLDFCSRRRDEVLDYVRRTHGEDRVALVATISTMRPKSALRETAKAYGLDEGEITWLSKRLPRGWHPDPRRRERKTVEDVLAELDDERLRRVVRQAYTVVGQPHHLSVHPGGLVVTPGPLTDYVPLQWSPKGFAITQFDHSDAEAIGLVKMDLLGIRALTVLSDAADLVRRRHDPAFRLESIPMDDPATGDLLSRAETIGVFQCESTGAQRTLRQLKARTPQDLAVANAFFKPGPATGGMAQAFIRRYRGEAPVSFLHPALEPILHTTKGVLLFQEQILRVATEIAGLTWAEAEHLRRGMSKFQPQEMSAMQERFVQGCQRKDGPGLTENQARTLWEQVAAFAGYGFNQGHATAYAAVSFRSAYLKAHYPESFLCARLADWGGFHHPAVYRAEARRLGIQVRPPHVNRSGMTFTLSYEPPTPSEENSSGRLPTLWMGLSQVRDLRRASIQAILQARSEALFADLRDLLQRVPLQTKEVEHLICCGGLDGLGENRASMLAMAEDIRRAGNVGQLSFDFGVNKVAAESPSQRFAWEKRILGDPVSVHPLALHPPIPQAVPLRNLRDQASQTVTVVGARLPGWTGGKGFFLDDGETFVVAVEPDHHSAPKPWQVVRIEGRWRTDEWGGGFLQADDMVVLPMPG
jgi:DNA-directed DNA polymerase III PolC